MILKMVAFHGVTPYPRRPMSTGRSSSALGGEQLQRLADVLVAVLAALLDEDGLVDAGVLEAPRFARIVGRADAAGAASQHLGAQLVAHGHELVPDVGAARPVLAEDVVVAQGELEEAEAVGAAAAASSSVWQEKPVTMAMFGFTGWPIGHPLALKVS